MKKAKMPMIHVFGLLIEKPTRMEECCEKLMGYHYIRNKRKAKLLKDHIVNHKDKIEDN